MGRKVVFAGSFFGVAPLAAGVAAYKASTGPDNFGQVPALTDARQPGEIDSALLSTGETADTDGAAAHASRRRLLE